MLSTASARCRTWSNVLTLYRLSPKSPNRLGLTRVGNENDGVQSAETDERVCLGVTLEHEAYVQRDRAGQQVHDVVHRSR